MGRNRKKQRLNKEVKVPNASLDEDEEAHNRLLQNIKQFHSKPKIAPATRTEPAIEVSEFNLSKEGKKRVSERDLIQAIKQKQPKVAQKLESIKKLKKLSKPLESIHEKKIQREVGFEEVKQKLDKWNDVVESNRLADQLKFPLKNDKIEVYDHSDSNLFCLPVNPTPLEKKLAKVLNSSEIAVNHEKKMEKSKIRLTLKEMIEKRKLFTRTKVQASYKIVKACRQNKIKSKNYHRILKKEKTKQQIKEFEELKKTDPDAAVKQLEQLERERARERATLRHKNSGKWAKNPAIKAMYNKEAFFLTYKNQGEESATAEINEESEDEESMAIDNEESEKEFNQFVNEYKKQAEEKSARVTKGVDIDSNSLKVIKVRQLNTARPEIASGGNEALDDDFFEEQMTISEAFADDDVVKEFREEEKKLKVETKPKELDSKLPGWGSWTGKSIKERKPRKPRIKITNKRLLYRVPKSPQKNENNSGFLITNEEKSSKLKEHLVQDLPFPFKSVKDYETSIRAPIGRTWLPESAHQKLIAPPVVTKLGTVIEPMNEDELLTHEEN